MEGMEGMEAVAHNPPALKQQRDRAQKRGFNLIEAAIVLGVVGLVIGGIWVAAATLYENYKVNKTVEGVFTTAKNIQNLISIRDAEAMGDVVITALATEASLFPKDWIINLNTVKSPFGGSVTALVKSFRLEVWMQNVPRALCIKITQKASAIAGSYMYKDSGLKYIYINSTGFSVFPAQLEDITTACASGANLGFFYGFTRIN